MKNLYKIEDYYNLLNKGESEFMKLADNDLQNKIKPKKLNRIIFIVSCILDFTTLYSKLVFYNKKSARKNIVYLSPNLCNFQDNVCTVPLIENLKIENILYINQSKEKHIARVNDKKVYNIGGLVFLINALFFKSKNSKTNTIFAYKLINDYITKKLYKTNVFVLCYYDFNGLSLVFSKFRKNFKLNEIQHGSMIDFYPYKTPANFAVIDTFIVRNAATISYLKSHLAQNYSANYQLIEYPKINLSYQDGLNILYASSIETNGFHEVFKQFLDSKTYNNLNLIVRLHPREQHNKEIFAEYLQKHNINYQFDTTKNWLEANTIKNLIVVSPWSSIIEEAIDNGFKTIIIDEIGKKRFKDYIDNKKCVFSLNISSLFSDFLITD